MFADVDCEDAIAMVAVGCEPPSYVGGYQTSGSCGSSWFATRRVNDKVGTPAKLYSNASGLCVLYTETPPAMDYYQAGAEVAPSTFVAATEELEH